MSSPASPKQKLKNSDIVESVTSSEATDKDVEKAQDLRKSSSSMEPGKKEGSLPTPPPKPKAGKSLLTTDEGEDVPLLEDDEEEIDMLEKVDVKPKKPRMSFSLRFRSKKKDVKPAPGRGSFIGFFMPKNANKAYSSVQGEMEKESRGDSVAWRRKESKEMTKSLQMDIDIYQYLKERSPSFEEEPNEVKDAVKVISKPPPKVTKREKKQKAPKTKSNLLMQDDYGPKAGMTRQPTRTADLELADRKKKGFFSRFNPFRRRTKDGKRRPGFASRIMSRMSFRPSSFQGTTADEMRNLLDEKGVKTEDKAEEEGLFRKDSDLTDLSDDSDIDSSLLVNDKAKITQKLPADVQMDDEEAHKSRQSKIFDDEEEKKEPPKKKGSFLGTEVTKASDDLPLVTADADRKSTDKIEEEASKNKVEKAFSLSSPSLNSPSSPNVKVVKTGARKTSNLDLGD